MQSKLYGGIYGEFQLTPEAAQEYAEVVSRDGHTTPEAVRDADRNQTKPIVVPCQRGDDGI